MKHILPIILMLSSCAFADYKSAILISDSIAFDCADCEAKDLYPNLIVAQANIDMHVIGTPGARISRFSESDANLASHIPYGLVDHLGDVDRLAGAYGPKLVMVALGANDIKPVKDVMADLRYFVHAAQEIPFVEVVIITPFHRADGGDNVALHDHMLWMCQQEKVMCIDSWKFTDKNPANFSDGVHRNKSGHAQIANGIISAMRAAGEW